jgi:hypothetical protein
MPTKGEERREEHPVCGGFAQKILAVAGRLTNTSLDQACMDMWTWGWLDSSGYGGVSSNEPQDTDGGNTDDLVPSVGGVNTCLPAPFAEVGAGGDSRWPRTGTAVEPPPNRMSVWSCTYNCAGRSPTDTDIILNVPQVEGKREREEEEEEEEREREGGGNPRFHYVFMHVPHV